MCQGLILRVRNATLPLCISCTRLANGADPADLIEPAAKRAENGVYGCKNHAPAEFPSAMEGS